MSTAGMDPSALLAGPRGRRLCAELLPIDFATSRRIERAQDPRSLAAEIHRLVSQVDLEALARSGDPAAFQDAFARSVHAARYWQEPDDLDRQLGHEAVTGALVPVADAVAAAPATRWWGGDLDPERQYVVSFDDPLHPRDREAVVDPVAALAEWRRSTLAHEERTAGFPRDWNGSSSWWSIPSLAGLTHSTRAIDDLGGPMGLRLVEDSWGPRAAECRRLTPGSNARIFEIHRPDDWIELVEAVPLDVPHSRRHDWWRATGADLPWLIPDYSALAETYDAVHLSPAGYLSTAGRALTIGAGGTVLAGWNPDLTWWLTDDFEIENAAVRWHVDRTDPDLPWIRE